MQETSLAIDTREQGGNPCVIPFRLGSDLVLKSILNPALKTRTTIYGAVPGQMIIIEEPSFFLNERYSDLSEGFTCAYLHGIYLFTFQSTFVKHLFNNVIGITYPTKVERIQIRSSKRIAVNIEGEIVLSTKAGSVSAIIDDMSKGGCRLLISKLIQIQKGAKFYLTFVLPDNHNIDNLICKVMNVTCNYDKNTTIVGVSFVGPSQTIAKIENFYRLLAFDFVPSRW